MKSTLYLVSILFTFLFSCHGNSWKESNKENHACKLSGHFVNKTALDKAKGGYGNEVDVTNYYALEISFSTSDSIKINNGFEKYSLAYSKTEKDCTFRMIKATQLGDMDFEALHDSLIILKDTAWTKLPTPSTFKRAGLEDGKRLDYNSHFNDAVIAGTYLYKNKEGKTTPVHFLSNGQVTGLQPYLSYSLCYAGDCLEETEKLANTIEFTDDTGSKKLFAIEINDAGELKFYSVADPKPDIKGERPIGEMVYVLKKESK